MTTSARSPLLYDEAGLALASFLFHKTNGRPGSLVGAGSPALPEQRSNNLNQSGDGLSNPGKP